MEGLRVSFLEKAAHLTNSRSPSTSAHLVSEGQALTRSSSTGTPPQGFDMCQRCGAVATSIWKAKPVIIKPSKKSSSRKSLAEPSTGTVVRRCSACGNVARLSTARKVKPPRSQKVQLSPPKLAGPELRSSPTSSTQLGDEPKLSSKKRAKAMKDREGLQALLNKRRPPAVTPQLSLVDFMRP